jgi:hypothetical protein
MLSLRTARGLDISELPDADCLKLLESARKYLSEGSLLISDNHLRIPESDMFISDLIIASLFC